MAEKSACCLNKSQKSKKEHVWTETELKYLALVLADEKKKYAIRPETVALKKSAYNQVFEEISKARTLASYFRPTSSTKRMNTEEKREVQSQEEKQSNIDST